MQIERLFANSSMAKKRRPSYISVNGVNQGSVETLLSPRTAKFINKSRRSSLVAEVLNGSSTGGSSGSSVENRRRSIINTLCDKSASSNDFAFPATESMEYTMAEDEEPLDLESSHPYQSFSSLTCPFSAMSTQPNSSGRPRSNSISSISEAMKALSQPNHLPNFDIHTMYKIKKRRSSSGNLDQSQAQVHKDVRIQDIKKDGLGAILGSKVPLCYFLHHLLEEYSCENLFFYLELEQYEKANYVSGVQQLATAEHIYDTYLARNCQFEVNLDDEVRASVTEALEEQNMGHCFRTAKRAVYLLLESSFMQFMRTDIWNQMIHNCGEVTEFYDNEKRDKAVNNLIGYVDKMQSMIYSNSNADDPVFMTVNQSTRKHHDMVKAMVHEFCRTLIGIEFEYYQSSSADDQPPSFSTPTSPTASLSPQNQQPQRRGLKQKHVVLFDFFGKKRPH